MFKYLELKKHHHCVKYSNEIYDITKKNNSASPRLIRLVEQARFYRWRSLLNTKRILKGQQNTKRTATLICYRGRQEH